MKQLLIGFMLAITGTSISYTQTNFYTNVTNLWYQGGEFRANVLTIANTRLVANTNGIAGLVLKAEYHFAFLEIGNISNSTHRVLNVGANITPANFAHEFISYTNDIHTILRVTPLYPPAEIAKDRQYFINRRFQPTATRHT